MNIFGIQRSKTPFFSGRDSPIPNISPPLPFPPEYYLSSPSSSSLPPPTVALDAKYTDSIRSSSPRPPPAPPSLLSRPAPAPAPALASDLDLSRPSNPPQHVHVSANPRPNHPGAPRASLPPPPPRSAAPPIEDHPAFRQDDCSSVTSTSFVPYSPSDYDLPSSYASSQFPPSPPTSPCETATTFSESPFSDNRASNVTWITQSSTLRAKHAQSRWHSSSDIHPPIPETPHQSSISSLDTDVDRSSQISVDLPDILTGKLDEVITSMDRRYFSGSEHDLGKYNIAIFGIIT